MGRLYSSVFIGAALFALTGCIHSGQLACRLVGYDVHGQMILHGPNGPAKWHAGIDECMLKLHVVEVLPEGFPIGVQIRGSEAQVKALQDRWHAEHAAQSLERKKI